MALGCASQSLSHAYVLRAHKMPAKQIVTKSSECPEPQGGMKMGGPAHKMTGDVKVGLQGFTCCAKQLRGGTAP